MIINACKSSKRNIQRESGKVIVAIGTKSRMNLSLLYSSQTHFDMANCAVFPASYLLLSSVLLMVALIQPRI